MNTQKTNVAIRSSEDKLGEKATERALNIIMDGMKSAYGEAQVYLGTAFSRYLDNATLRYNQVRTLATGQNPRNLIGKDNIYVSIGVQYGEKEIDTETVDSLLSISNNILIQGTGGIGKSMLMRYLFLNTANRGEYVPVLLQLRRISNQESEQISIIDLIYTCMKDFDIQLPVEQFEYSLRLGKYLFLMDGFDEVKEERAKETAEAIQNFCSKYPKNPCIITSRPRRDTSPLETFTEVRSKTLNLQQAVLLSSKIWKEDEKTRGFCRQLEEELYEKHKDFAENPLLLSMMFLTFMKNNSVPEHLAEFYSKAYDAIYSAHDSHDKGYFLREFKCKDLDENGFRMMLCHFCFHTYFKEIYEFSEKELLGFLNQSIQKLGIRDVKAKDYLKDLCDVVCILVEEGDVYRFSHRSFQTYFAACYTSNILTDVQQRKLFQKDLSFAIYWNRADYYELLAQIEPRRFAENVLEDGLRDVRDKLNKSSNLEIDFIKMRYKAFEIQGNNGGLSFLISDKKDALYNYNVVTLFMKYVLTENKRTHRKKDIQQLSHFVKRLDAFERGRFTDFEDIDKSVSITYDEKKTIWKIIVLIENTKNKIESIYKWLKQLDDNRAILTTDNFIDDL
ncbi:MAG: NACHT domain-containing protein [Lachnospiraceae bacterium]|nr:NACHT domain-containing protein [Lachnospiraceae bacterium]